MQSLLSLAETLLSHTQKTGSEPRFNIRRLTVISREVSKPRGLYLELSERFEIWHAPRQHCCRCACQISKRCDNSNYQSRGFETEISPKDVLSGLNGVLVRHRLESCKMCCFDKMFIGNAVGPWVNLIHKSVSVLSGVVFYSLPRAIIYVLFHRSLSTVLITTTCQLALWAVHSLTPIATLRSRQNRRHFADAIFKLHFLEWKCLNFA